MAAASRGLAPIVRHWSARARRPVLSVGGLACVTVAAFTVATALGWLAAGVNLLVLEVLTGPESE